MPRAAKSKSINRAQKWKQWYIKQDNKWWVRFFIMLSSWKSAYHLFMILLIYFNLSFLYAGKKRTLEDHFHISTNNAPTQIYPKKFKLHCKKENRLPPKQLSRLVNKNTFLNLNTTFYFFNFLVSSGVLTWFTTNGNHRNTIERM